MYHKRAVAEGAPRDINPLSPRYRLKIEAWKKLPLWVANRVGHCDLARAGLMGDILFLAHRVPYPPNRGDKIRGFHILKHLSGRKRVHLIAFADDTRDMKTKNALANIPATARSSGARNRARSRRCRR